MALARIADASRLVGVQKMHLEPKLRKGLRKQPQEKLARKVIKTLRAAKKIGTSRPLLEYS